MRCMATNRIPTLIAHVIFRLDVGGLENGLVNLINGLPVDRFRHAIICIDDFTDFRLRIQRDDVEVIAIRKKPGTDLSALWRLYKVFRRVKPDIVHTRNIGALDALMPALLAGVRIRIHGEHGWDVNDPRGLSKKMRLLRKIHSPMVVRYIALSINLKRYLTDKVGIREKRITQLYNGVDTAIFKPSVCRSSDRAHVNGVFDEHKILIGTVGRMQAVKDPLNLAQAFVRLIKRSPELSSSVRLVMIGDGPLRENVLSLLGEAGMKDLAWVPGSREDVPRLMRILDVYVQPSLAEGVSNTILEAMSSALPVVATDVGGNAELVIHGQTGTIVPSGDADAMSNALEHYVREPALRAAHGASGRKRAKNTFGMDIMLRSYSETYDSLAGTSTGINPLC